MVVRVGVALGIIAVVGVTREPRVYRKEGGGKKKRKK